MCPKLLETLREYWRWKKARDMAFPNQHFGGRDSLPDMKWLGPSALMLLSSLWAQEKPAFEAASIHANTSSETGQPFFDLSGAGRVITRNMDVWDLVRLAFGLRDTQMAGGPAWIKSEGFDIQAAASATGTVVARPRALQMLQTLLEDRFHLRWHNEMR